MLSSMSQKLMFVASVAVIIVTPLTVVVVHSNFMSDASTLATNSGFEIPAQFEKDRVDENVLRVFGYPASPSVFDKCESSAYPPKNILPPPDEYEINLDLPANYRWVQLAQDKQAYISRMLDGVKNSTQSLFGGKLFDYVNKYLPLLAAALPSPFREEIQGMSEITEIPYGELLLYNIFYEIFSVCTSVVAQNQSGTLFHARNLDFGLFMGWDFKNHTWITTENLRPMVVKLNFTRHNQTVFQTVSFAGYVGVLTGLKKNTFTLTINERFGLKGGFFGLLEWLLGKNLHWMGFLTREVMENATSYKEAQKLLMKTSLLAPVYFILGGTEPGEGCVITRGQTAADLWTLDKPLNNHGGNVTGASRGWFLVQTNYDHWRSPPPWDDRLTPAMTCLVNSGPANLSFASLYNALSTRPVLNKLTTYTALMQVGGQLEVYLRECSSPCWPW